MSDMIAIIPVKGTIAAAKISENKDKLKKIDAVWQGDGKFYYAIPIEQEAKLKELLFEEIGIPEKDIKLERIADGVGKNSKKAKEFAEISLHASERLRELDVKRCAKLAGLESVGDALSDEEKEKRREEIEEEHKKEAAPWEREIELCEEAMVKAGIGEKSAKEAKEEEAARFLERVSEVLYFVGGEYNTFVYHTEESLEEDRHLERQVSGRKFCLKDRKFARDTILSLSRYFNAKLDVDSFVKNSKEIHYMIFDPSKKSGIAEEKGKAVLNLWCGFAVKPVKGDCSKFKAHLKDGICKGSQEKFDSLWKTFSSWVQQPDVKTYAVVLRGGQGTGKGLVCETFCSIFGRAALKTSSPESVFGKFNEGLFAKAFVFLEEMKIPDYYEARLKDFIYGGTVNIGKKFADTTVLPNFMNVIASSNKDCPLPMERDDRRFFVLDAKEGLPFEYFQEILAELRNGGIEAFLHELLQTDLSGFSPQLLPKNRGAVGNIKIESDPVIMFLQECVAKETLRPSIDTELTWKQDRRMKEGNVDSAIFFGEFEIWCAKRRLKIESIVHFYRKIGKCLGDAYKKKQVTIGDTRPYFATFKEPKILRAKIAEYLSCEESEIFEEPVE